MKRTARIEIRTTEERKEQIDSRVEVLGIDRTAYMERLIDEDIHNKKDTIYNRQVCMSIQNMSKIVYELSEAIDNMDDEQKYLVEDLEKEMNKIWLYLN